MKKFNTLRKYKPIDLSYCDPQTKKGFHKESKSFLRQLAKDVKILDYDLRSNMGGIAVSGEITLHSEHLYVQISRGPFKNDIEALIRTCKGKKDYSGGNNYFFFFNMGEYAEMINLCKKLIDNSTHS